MKSLVQNFNCNCPTVSVNLAHGLNEDAAILVSKLKRYMIDLNQNIQKVTMKLAKSEFMVEGFINSLLNTARLGLKEIEIHKGNLRQYQNNNNDSQEGGHLDRLEFRGTIIDDECLSSLVTTEFSNLQLLKVLCF